MIYKCLKEEKKDFKSAQSQRNFVQTAQKHSSLLRPAWTGSSGKGLFVLLTWSWWFSSGSDEERVSQRHLLASRLISPVALRLNSQELAVKSIFGHFEGFPCCTQTHRASLPQVSIHSMSAPLQSASEYSWCICLFQWMTHGTQCYTGCVLFVSVPIENVYSIFFFADIDLRIYTVCMCVCVVQKCVQYHYRLQTP